MSSKRKPASPAIHVDNKDTLVDDVIAIRVTGLAKHQHVSVHTSVMDRDVEFAAVGCFRADDKGNVDLTQSPSLQGTYTGVSAMGLFWSMKPMPAMPIWAGLFKRNVSEPVNTTIRVLPGHLGLDEIYGFPREPVAELTIRRWYLARDVRRVPVKEGRVRGSLFLPSGNGPFPGLIDLFGGTGAAMEFRAALLASRGFASLALAYVGYDDLPSKQDNLQMEYFLEAADWLSSLLSVRSGGIGVIGLSKGGQLGLRLGYHSPKVKAVVAINAPPFTFESNISLGESIWPPKKWDWADVDITEEGLRLSKVFKVVKEEVVPIWERDVKVLLIVGGDDQGINCQHLMDFSEYYPPEKKRNVQLIVYPGAGHLIMPPFSPLLRSTYETQSGNAVTLMGGQVADHAKAQEDSWRRILEFFRRELTDEAHYLDNTTKSKL